MANGCNLSRAVCEIGKIHGAHCCESFYDFFCLTNFPLNLFLYICHLLLLIPYPATMLSSYSSSQFSLPPPFLLHSNPLVPFLLLLLLLSDLSILSRQLHFSDYTPIKDSVGTLFACCSLSLETEKMNCVCASVSPRARVYVHSRKSYLKKGMRVCVCLIADGSPLLNPY